MISSVHRILKKIELTILAPSKIKVTIHVNLEKRAISAEKFFYFPIREQSKIPTYQISVQDTQFVQDAEWFLSTNGAVRHYLVFVQTAASSGRYLRVGIFEAPDVNVDLLNFLC